MPVDANPAVRDLLSPIAERERSEPDSYPAESIKSLYDAGVIASPFPQALGGSDATLAEAVANVEAIATASPSVALIASMPLGFAGIFGFGADIAPTEHRDAFSEQIDRVAADFRNGLIYAACNSEKGAGGSLDATKTVASANGSGGFVINGEKILASSGGNAATFVSTAKVSPEELPGAGVVEFFLVDVNGAGVTVLDDWDGFGMRPTESQTVVYDKAPVRELMGFPNFIEIARPLEYFYLLFAAIPLGCAKSILTAIGSPAPQSPALRLRLSEAVMRYEALRAYLLETAAAFRPAADAEYAARVLRTKTYVTQEATKLAAELFALGGGRNYRRNSPVARALADSFAGTALRPPLALALERLSEEFSLGGAE